MRGYAPILQDNWSIYHGIYNTISSTWLHILTSLPQGAHCTYIAGGGGGGSEYSGDKLGEAGGGQGKTQGGTGLAATANSGSGGGGGGRQETGTGRGSGGAGGSGRVYIKYAQGL